MESKEFNSFIEEIKIATKDTKIMINFSEDSNKLNEEFNHPELKLSKDLFIYDLRISTYKKGIDIRMSYEEGYDFLKPPIEEGYRITLSGDLKDYYFEFHRKEYTKDFVTFFDKSKIEAGKLFKNVTLDVLDWFKFREENLKQI